MIVIKYEIIESVNITSSDVVIGVSIDILETGITTAMA
jgi:hypothetical protein